MELKNFIDFVYSMTNMDEVKNGKFILPKEIVFTVDKSQHISLHREIKNEKKEFNYENLEQDFELTVFNVNIKFKLDET